MGREQDFNEAVDLILGVMTAGNMTIQQAATYIADQMEDVPGAVPETIEMFRKIAGMPTPT